MKNIEKHIDDTFKRKNHDYGPSFHDSIAEFGLVAAIVRMNDKMKRLKTLAKKKDVQVKDESIRDTLLDLVNYAVMTAIEMDSSIRPDALLTNQGTMEANR